MKIIFAIEPDIDADDYRELYTADVTMEDGTNFTVRATEDDVTYDQFRADIFEDLFMSLAEATGIEVEVEEDDYAVVDEEGDIIFTAEDDDDLGDENNGC